MGEARPLNLLNIAAWLMSTCSHPHLFCLRSGDHALAPCVLTPCVYMQRQRQETSKQAMEGKGAKSISKRHKADKHDRRGKQRNKEASKQARKQTKGGVCEGKMQIWIRCPQLYCVEVWTTHQQARLMHEHVSKHVEMHRKPTGGINKHGKHSIAWGGKGKGTRRANRHSEMPSKQSHPNKASWASNITKQDQARRGRQAWQSLEQERLAQV